MSGGEHADLGPELRRLAQVILDRFGPTVRAAAAGAPGRPGRCQQVWCPVCALAALITGEEHPLIGVIGEHSVALLTVITAMVADAHSAASAEPPPPPTDADPAPPPPGTGTGTKSTGTNGNGTGANGRYQHIPIVVEPVDAGDKTGPPV